MKATAQPQSSPSVPSSAETWPQRATTLRWLVVLLLAGLVLRLGLWTVYEPVAYPDTGSYMRMAKIILTGEFADYDGRRPPGYPLILAAAGLSPNRAWAIQSTIGLATSVLLFYVALALTYRPSFAAIIGMTYNLNLSQLFFEANLVSETTATFAISGVVALLLVSYQRLRDNRRVWPWLLALGLFAAFATLTRPQFAFLPVLIATLIGYTSYTRAGARSWRWASHLGVSFLTSTVLILGWCSFNYAKVDFFTLSTQTGIDLMHHTLGFIELAPDRYATIRDIYVRYRDEKRALTGRHNAAWDGVWETMKTTRLSLPALSKELARLSIEMFVRHPLRYAAGVVQAWVDFWPAPIYWQPAMLRLPSIGRFVQVAWRLEQPMIRLTNALFVGLVAAVTLSPTLRRRLHWDLGLTTLAAIVLLASVVQALAIWTDNARYAISVQPLVILILLSTVARQLFPPFPDAVLADGSIPKRGMDHPSPGGAAMSGDVQRKRAGFSLFRTDGHKAGNGGNSQGEPIGAAPVRNPTVPAMVGGTHRRKHSQPALRLVRRQRRRGTCCSAG